MTVEGTIRLDDFIRVISDSSRDDVIHIHWTSPIVQNATDDADAQQRRLRFERAIGSAMSRGSRVIWSIHNVLPHGVLYREEELALCRFLSARASRIHILSSRTREAIGDLYPVDDNKLVRIPHSSYWGVYDQGSSRESARAAHGLQSDDVVIGLIGQLRPYKGVDDLIHAVQVLQEKDPSIVLLLAGKTWEQDKAIFDELTRGVARIIRSHNFIPEEELSTWMRLIDVMALPYRTVLNSGSVALAATFGVPVVTPREAGFVADIASEPWLTTYESLEDEQISALTAALLTRLDQGLAIDTSAIEWSREYTPYEMSKRFTRAVLEGI